jgi:hypothetical protein
MLEGSSFLWFITHPCHCLNDANITNKPHRRRQGAIANILRDFLFERDKRFDIPVYLAYIVEITSPD